MENLFVTYEMALKLKSKGFEEFCLAFYANAVDSLSFHKNKNTEGNYDYVEIGNFPQHGISAPLYQQVIDWLDNKGICIFISPYEAGTDNGSDLTFVWEIINKEKKITVKTDDSCYDSRIDAIKVAIEEALRLIKK